MSDPEQNDVINFRNPFPRKYTPELGQRVCEALMAGLSLRKACNSGNPQMPSYNTVIKWLADAANNDFHVRYQRARRVQAELWIDEIMGIADDASEDFKEVTFTKRNGDQYTRTVVDHEHINRSRLRIDTRKWYASKVLPKLYGEKILEGDHPGEKAMGDLIAWIAQAANKSNGLPKPVNEPDETVG